jgi:predicted ester cyclase
MSQESKDLLRRAWAAYSQGDEQAFAACLTDDWIEHDNDGGTIALADELPVMRLHREGFPDKKTEIHDVLADGDRVAVRSTTRATHTGPYLGLAATGKEVIIHEISIHRIVDSRIAETWQVTEGVGFYQQITGRTAPMPSDNMG